MKNIRICRHCRAKVPITEIKCKPCFDRLGYCFLDEAKYKKGDPRRLEQMKRMYPKTFRAARAPAGKEGER